MSNISKQNILVLCTGNSCRSIMGEALLRHYAADNFIAHSAGSKPAGSVATHSLATLQSHGINTDHLRSKSWDEFTNQPIDIVITVCGNAANEICPTFQSQTAGQPLKTHWGVDDPFKKSDVEYLRAFTILEKRIKALANLKPDQITQANLDKIGHII